MADVKLVPLEVLLGHPERAAPQISPDGTRLSYIAPLDGVLNVFVGNVGAGDDAPVTHDTERGIQGYLWAHDNRHLLYVRDKDGSENYRLYDVDLETGVERDLTPMDGVQCRLIAHRKRFPNDVLVGMNKDNPQLHDVYHLDLTTGELEKVVENPGYLGWVVDDDLMVRGAVTPTPDGGMVILVRDDESADWRPLLGVAPEDAESTGPLGFTKDGTGMYLQTSADSNTGRVVKLDIATGAVEVIAEDPSYDISGVIMHPDTLEIQGVVVYRDRLEYQIFDDSIRGDIEALAAAHEGDLMINDRDDDDTTWLVAYDDDSGPVKFYTWDRAEEDRDVPVRPPAASSTSIRWCRWSPSRSRRATGSRFTATSPSPRASSAPTSPPCWWCTADRGHATGGGWIPKRSGWRTVATYACKSTSAVPADTARTSSTRATVSGAPRCTTTCWTPSTIWSREGSSTATGWRSTAGHTAATRRWSEPRSRRTCSHARSRWSARRISTRSSSRSPSTGSR